MPPVQWGRPEKCLKDRNIADEKQERQLCADSNVNELIAENADGEDALAPRTTNQYITDLANYNTCKEGSDRSSIERVTGR